MVDKSREDGGWTPLAAAVGRTATQAPSRVAPSLPLQRPGVEDVLAGRSPGLLALIGGFVVLLAVAISRRGVRTLCAALASFSRAVAAAWVREQRATLVREAP